MTHPTDAAGNPALTLPNPIILPEHLDIAATDDFIRLFLAHRGSPLLLDGTLVRSLCTPFVQLLLSAGAQWRADKQPFALTSPSPALSEGLARLGIESDLLPGAPAADTRGAAA